MKTGKKDKKILAIAAVTAICVTGAAGGILVYAAQMQPETILTETAKEVENGAMEMGYDSERLYKDFSYLSESIKKKVCSKYQLDYDTVKVKEITREMSNYEYALYLLEKNAEDDMDKLELNLDEAFAFSGAKESIQVVCEEAGLDYFKAKVSDFSEEQLVKMQDLCFAASDHDNYDMNQLVPEEIKKQVCSRYGLDYDTVQNTEITGEIKLYEQALIIASSGEQGDMEDLILALIKDKIREDQVREVVQSVCEEAGLDFTTAAVGDFTIEQLIEIQNRLY